MSDDTTTVRDALNSKLAAAHAKVADAQGILATLQAEAQLVEAEIASIPEHLHLMTWAEIRARVESWFN